MWTDLRRVLCLVGVLGSFTASAAPTAGWRIDGTSVIADAAPPSAWVPAEATWTTPLQASGHASPVVWGDRVCVLEEPDTVACFEATSGSLAWRVAHPVMSALSGDARDAYAASEAEAVRIEAELATAQREHAQLLRAARRSPGEAAAALEAGSKRLDALEAAWQQASAHRPTEVPEIGFAAATPLVADGVLYATFGHGVVAAMSADGSVLWRRWLGPENHDMRGYRAGHAASPRWVDGVLVVARGQLMGLSAATGEVRWRAGDYRDYGTPEVGHLGDVGVVLTPDGRVVRARDGVVLADGLGDLWYQGPLLHQGVAYYVGATGYGPGDGAVMARAWRLSVAGDAVKADPVWTTELPITDRIYATPVVVEDRLVIVTAKGTLLALDRGTGKASQPVTIELPIPGKAYANPVLAGGTLFVSFDHGVHLALDPLTFATRHMSVLSRGMSTPWFEGRRVFVRTAASLSRFEAKR
jgi:outer membrane protein assembly factor BamB